MAEGNSRNLCVLVGLHLLNLKIKVHSCKRIWKN